MTGETREERRLRISRREALRLIGLGAGATIVAACSPAAVSPTHAPAKPASPVPSQPAAAVPTQVPAVVSSGKPVLGGTLTTYADGVPGSFDMHIEVSIRTAVPISPCYNSLLRADEAEPAKVAPDLAESWDSSNGGRTLTFKLLDNVTFHEGQPFTAEDAKFSLERARTVPQARYKTWFGAVESIEAVDKRTLRINLKYPDSSLFLALASPWIAMYSKPWVEGGHDPRTEVNGTGPFRLAQYTKGSQYKLVKNPQYFRKGRPYLDGYDIFFMEQDQQLPNLISKRMIWSGVAAKSCDTPAKQDQLRNSVKGIVIEPYQGMSGSRVVYNLKVKPLDDVRVRRALDLAIDRPGANKALYDGAGSVMGPNSITAYALPLAELQTYYGYRPDAAANLEEAKKLLAEAGVGPGLKLDILTFETSHTVDAATYVKDRWARIGVQSEVVIKDLPTADAIRGKGDFVTTVDSIAERQADPVGIFGKYLKGDALNFGLVDDQTIASSFQELRSETDFNKRVQISRQIEKRILDQAYDSVVVGRPSWQAWWPEMKGYRVGIGHYHTYIRMEQVWLEKA